MTGNRGITTPIRWPSVSSKPPNASVGTGDKDLRHPDDHCDRKRDSDASLLWKVANTGQGLERISGRMARFTNPTNEGALSGGDPVRQRRARAPRPARHRCI
jgi:hypothetical protein